MVICQGVDTNNTSIKSGVGIVSWGLVSLDLSFSRHQAVTENFLARGWNEYFCSMYSIKPWVRPISVPWSLIYLMAMALSDGVNTTGENRRRILRRFLARKNKKGAIKGTSEACKIIWPEMLRNFNSHCLHFIYCHYSELSQTICFFVLVLIRLLASVQG